MQPQQRSPLSRGRLGENLALLLRNLASHGRSLAAPLLQNSKDLASANPGICFLSRRGREAAAPSSATGRAVPASPPWWGRTRFPGLSREAKSLEIAREGVRVARTW